MSRPSSEIFHALGQNAAVVGYLESYLKALEPEEEARLQELAQSTLFDEGQRQAALVQFGRLALVRELLKNLGPYVLQHSQHMR